MIKLTKLAMIGTLLGSAAFAAEAVKTAPVGNTTNTGVTGGAAAGETTAPATSAQMNPTALKSTPKKVAKHGKKKVKATDKHSLHSKKSASVKS